MHAAGRLIGIILRRMADFSVTAVIIRRFKKLVVVFYVHLQIINTVDNQLLSVLMFLSWL